MAMPSRLANKSSLENGCCCFISRRDRFPFGNQELTDQSKGTRPGNRDEHFDRFIAQEVDETELSEKISWNALLPGGGFLAPSQQRSECYEFIAGRTKNPKLCWKAAAPAPLANRLLRRGAFHAANSRNQKVSSFVHFII
jgi:hypothetical protein